jgi:molybdopterin-biosynthesis enzyme MoeA-like protein
MGRTAGIILIGNELLSGKVVDANAAYLCRELRALGVDVRRIVVIPDEVGPSTWSSLRAAWGPPTTT